MTDNPKDAERLAQMPLENLRAFAVQCQNRDGDLLAALGDRADRWAAAFCAIAKKLDKDIDEDWMIGWFANAIEHSSHVRNIASRDATIAKLRADLDLHIGMHAVTVGEYEKQRATIADLERRLAEARPCDKIFEHKWLDPECVERGCKSLAAPPPPVAEASDGEPRPSPVETRRRYQCWQAFGPYDGCRYY